MTVTEIRFAGIPRGDMLGYVHVVLDGVLAIKGIQLRRKLGGGISLAMPQRDLGDGRRIDIAHPICSRFRSVLEKAVFVAYCEQIGDPGTIVLKVVKANA